MEYKEIMAKSIQHCSTTAIQIHPIEDFYIMEIHYEDIVNSIVDNLNRNGYTVIKGSSSVG